MKRLYVAAAILVCGSLLIAACDSPVGLGSQMSMAGPVVSIAEPAPNRAADVQETDPVVGTLFNLKGTVRDEVKITLMTVTLDYWNAPAQTLVRMGREWKWEDRWLTRESSSAPWKPYTSAEYNLSDAVSPINPIAWSVFDRNSVSWNLPVFMNRMEKGDYFINVSAWNSAGRHDSRSAAKLKIKFNNQSPTVKITNPLLLDGGGSLAFPRPPSHSAYVFDPFNRPEETSLNLRYFTNSFKDLSYQIEYAISAPTEFSFEITNEHDLDAPGEEKTAYYGWQWENDGLPPIRGIFTDRAGAVGDTIDTYDKAGEMIELSGPVKNSLPQGAVTPMQIVTRVKDSTGLEEYKAKGWFLYLPDSDKPYPDISFAHKVRKDSEPPPGAPELASMARGSFNHNNTAYDDDGVRAVKWTLYKLRDTGLEVERTAGSDLIACEGNKKETWSFQADRSYGTGRFKIVVEAQDIYGLWGDEYHGYFTITSNNTPTVVTPLDSPASLTATFWGDGGGNITIAGRAQIEDYDGCNGANHGIIVSEAAIAWLKPGLGVANNFRYSDPNDPLWNTTGADSYGNKIWKIVPDFVASTAGNASENFMEEWAFSQTLNYFNDLGIGFGAGKLPFTEQQFRIRVTGAGAGAPRSSVHSFTTRGDMAAPVVEITHIVIEHDSTEITYNIAPYMALPSIAQGDRVMLKGTYRDDSLEQWAALGANRHRTLLSPNTGPDVTWDSETRKFKFNIASYTLDEPGGGSWETGWYTFTASNTDPVIQLNAVLTDIGGRPGTGSGVLVVETADPVLIRVSSSNSDGYYGEHKPTVAGEPGSRYIDIFLEFNKPVTFAASGQTLTSANAPRLELNNGGEAFYLVGNGASRITFRYFVDGAVNPSLSTAVAGKGGGNSPVETGNPEGRLNAANVNFNGFAESQWKSLTGVPVIFQKTAGRLSVCSPSSIFSLSAQKRIIVDKTPPLITGVSTAASTQNHHGAGSQINIELSFNKDVQISGAAASNTYLALAGGNLASVRAAYDHIKDARTVSFLYTVQNGHDTSEYAQKFLGVSQAVIGAVVKDAAENTLAEYPPIPGSPAYLNGVVIDTVAPQPPVIYGVSNGQTYYSGAGFYIGGLEAGGGMVEYHLNYPTSGGVPATGWTAYAGSISGGQTGAIPLDLNGIYNIAARQYDTATTPNRSQPSAAVEQVRVDNGALLERMSSALPDGSYSSMAAGKDVITVTMEFRVPVTLAGGYSAGNLPTVNIANIALNTSGGATNLARLSDAPANGKKWTFEYAIPEGARTPPPNTVLDVTALNLDGIRINDQWGTRVNGPGGYIHLSDMPQERKFSSQKKMIVLAGRPEVMNPQIGGGIVFTGTQLRLEFDRDIYRGNASQKLMIRQIEDGFKIPAAMTEEKYNDVFVNRSDIFTEQSDIVSPWSNNYNNPAIWQTHGEFLYEKGSNGAAPQGNNKLVSDTTVKRVLRYEVDPDDDNYSFAIFPANITMSRERTAFRAAEALTFIPGDREITFNGNTLTIDLSSSGRPLPVKGARYEWIFPNGFVKDALGTANGTGEGGDSAPAGRDSNLTSGNTPTGERVLFYSSAAEPPVIRIDKGSDIPAFNNSTVNRQALQPLTTTAKINSRTPNAAVSYWVRQVTQGFSAGNIYVSLWSEASGWKDEIAYFRLRSDLAYDVPDDWGAARNYTPGSTGFEIGSEYYSVGGMIIELRARSAAPGVAINEADYGYEAAYRSVLVYNNYPAFMVALSESLHGYTHPVDGYFGPVSYESFRENSLFLDIPHTHLHLLNRSASNEDITIHRPGNNSTVSYRFFTYDNSYSTSGLDRVWLQGSNTAAGDASIPNFPLSRDLAQSRKVPLLTPLNNNAVLKSTKIELRLKTSQDQEYFDRTHLYLGYIDPVSSLTAANIPTGAVGTGNFLWAWVTWNINVPAYVELLYGELPADANDPYQTPRANLRYVLADSRKRDNPFTTTHLMTPGRLTHINLGDPIGQTSNATDQVQNFYLGSPFPAPARSD